MLGPFFYCLKFLQYIVSATLGLIGLFSIALPGFALVKWLQFESLCEYMRRFILFW